VSAIDAARTDLGFAPQVGFEKGLELTMAWYAAKKQAESSKLKAQS
jgi:dTDP-D-glucose 4,6-dehydratase